MLFVVNSNGIFLIDNDNNCDNAFTLYVTDSGNNSFVKNIGIKIIYTDDAPIIRFENSAITETSTNEYIQLKAIL